MEHKKIFLALVFLLFCCQTFTLAVETKDPGESAGQVSDFSLSGYGEKGKKSWDLSGKSANIFNEVVKLQKVVGNNYTPNDTINLTADKGDFNKNSGLVHLEDNVVITTQSGSRLTTDTLDWDRKQQVVNTLDRVNLARQDMNLSGQGASGKTELKQITLVKDVRLDIQAAPEQAKAKEKIVITCDGPLDVDYEKNIAVFNNNVKVEKPDMTIYSDKMEAFFTTKEKDKNKVKPKEGNAQGAAAVSSSIDKIVASGNVRILRGENISYSQKAIYTAADKKITLTGRPQIVIYQTENSDAAFGD